MTLSSSMLLAGPRGRRLLLEYALESERIAGLDERDGSLAELEFFASYRLDPRKGTGALRVVGPGDSTPKIPAITPAHVAARLETVPLADVTPRLLLTCLVNTVETAAYWQELDGTDVLAATKAMRDGLRRVAEHLAASEHTAWWNTPIDTSTQWTVQWDNEPGTVPQDPLAVLKAARAHAAKEERLAARERPTNPTASWSGEWWSTPHGVPASTRELFDTTPAGLWLVEDSMGWETAETLRLSIPEGLRIYEIDSAEAWAELCRRFPLNQTAQKRHDWYRTTGRNGKWVTPDWSEVAQHYDAVHLPVATYLAAAGTAIPVDADAADADTTGADTASVIAGWGPDTTYWFTPRINHIGGPVDWVLKEHDAGENWERE